jgi:hypothetical protein
MPFDAFVWSCIASACVAMSASVFVIFAAADNFRPVIFFFR